MSRRDTFGGLLNRFKAELGWASSGSADILRYALEEALSAIADKVWPWSIEKTSFITYATVTESLSSAAIVWSGNAREDFITSDIAHGYTYTMVGRKFLWGSETYTIKKVVGAGVSSTQIFLDRKLGETLEDQSLVFYRDEINIYTSAIRGVWINGVRAHKLLQDSLTNNVKTFGTPYYGWTEGSPFKYMPNDAKTIDPPAFPPVPSTGAALTGFVGGRYRYFFVRFDAESGLESAPGPEVEWTASDDFQVDVDYGSDSGELEGDGYGLRLYRTDVDPDHERVPFYLVGTRGPEDETINDTAKTVRSLSRYIDAPHTVLQLIPPPDDEAYTVAVEKNRPFNSRASDEDPVDLGTEASIWSLLRIFLAGIAKMRDGDAAQVRSQIVSFRQQLSYIAEAVRPADFEDLSGESNVIYDRKHGLRPDLQDGEQDIDSMFRSPSGVWET